MYKSNGILLILLSVIFLSCTPPIGYEEVLIQKGYQGSVLILFDSPTNASQKAHIKNIYRIDSTGILRFQELRPEKNSAYSFFFYEDSKILDSIPYFNPLELNNDKEKYKNDTRIVTSFLESGVYADKNNVKKHFTSFVVGRICDLDSLMEKHDNFISDNLYK